MSVWLLASSLFVASALLLHLVLQQALQTSSVHLCVLWLIVSFAVLCCTELMYVQVLTPWMPACYCDCVPLFLLLVHFSTMAFRVFPL